MEIGFEGVRESWPDAKPDESTNELWIMDHPVMQRWETPYMYELAQVATTNGGRVLEVGFGMGISADFISDVQEVAEHVIIEANAEIARKARLFSGTQPASRCRILEGFWEEVIQELPNDSFDGILFDTYPTDESTIHRNHFPFFVEAHRVLRSGGVLTYYSDEPTHFSDDHLQALAQASFTSIRGEICEVQPPEKCDYWKHSTILVPIIHKT